MGRGNWGANALTHHNEWAVIARVIMLVIDAMMIVPSVAVAYVISPWGSADVGTDTWPRDPISALRDGMVIVNPALIFLNAALAVRGLRRRRWPGVIGWLTIVAGTAFAALYITPLALIALL